MPIYRTKLKYETMKLKAYEKIIWMIELGAIYLLELKSSLLVHPESAINEGLLSNRSFTRN